MHDPKVPFASGTPPETVAQPARRTILKNAGLAAAGAASIVAAPFIRNAAAAETTTWKVQTSWPAGVGLQTFKTWAATVKEKTGGEL
jgi:TRAP-type mannitol/chloroaromatic compound transport system substrate-binding protein